MCTDRSTDIVDHKILISETFFDQISDKLCVFQAVSMADEDDIIFIFPASDALFHHGDQRRQRFLSSPYLT